MRSNIYIGFSLISLAIPIFSIMMVFIDLQAHPDYFAYRQYYLSYLAGDIHQFHNTGVRIYYYINEFLNPEPENIIVVYFINIIVCFLLLGVISVQKNVNITGVFLYSALFMTLFSLVLLRAGPAYLLTAIGVTTYQKSKTLGLLIATAAVFFHISSVIVLFILLILVIWRRYNFGHKLLFILTIVLYIGMYAMPDLLANFIHLVVNAASVGSLEKYAVYASYQGETSIFHRVYFFIVFTMQFFFLRNQATTDFTKLFINLIIFASVLFSIVPVVGFRLSIFAVGQILLLFPFGKYGLQVQSVLISLSFMVIAFTYHDLLNG